jgi:hypothetical protein
VTNDFSFDFLEVESISGKKRYYPIGYGSTPSNPYKSDFDSDFNEQIKNIRTVRCWHDSLEAIVLEDGVWSLIQTDTQEQLDELLCKKLATSTHPQTTPSPTPANQ